MGVAGSYWLAKLSTRSYQTEEEYAYAGGVIEAAGFYVAKVRGQANFKSPSPRPRPNDVAFGLCLMFLLGRVAVLLSAPVPLHASCQLLGVRLALGFSCPCRCLVYITPMLPT